MTKKIIGKCEGIEPHERRIVAMTDRKRLFRFLNEYGKPVSVDRESRVPVEKLSGIL